MGDEAGDEGKAALQEAIAVHEGEKRTLRESVEKQKAELEVGAVRCSGGR